MIKALSLSTSWEFQDKDDPDFGTEEASKFTLRALDSRVMAKLKDGAAKILVDPTRPDDAAETSINMENMNFETVQFGCEGWENVVDPDAGNGALLEYDTVPRRLGGRSYKIVDPDVLCRVPLSTIRKMAEDIRAKNELSDDDAKN
jgi:hypothetical protein